MQTENWALPYSTEGARQLTDKTYFCVQCAVAHISSDTDSSLEKYCPEMSCIEFVLKELVDDQKDLLSAKDVHASFAAFPFHSARFYM